MGLKILQQIAIVTGYLQHLAAAGQLEPGDDHIHVCLAMGQPAGGVGAEILVFSKDVLRLLVQGGLGQKTVFTYMDLQRIKDLPPAQVCFSQILVGQRREAQICKSVLQFMAAETAVLVVHVTFPHIMSCVRPKAAQAL